MHFGRSQRQPSFAPKQQEREETEGTKKKRNCGEMVSLGRGQPQAPLTTDAQQQQHYRNRAKGRAMGKSRRGKCELVLDGRCYWERLLGALEKAEHGN